MKMLNLYDKFDGHFGMLLVSTQNSFEHWKKHNSKPTWFHNKVREIISKKKHVVRALGKHQLL